MILLKIIFKNQPPFRVNHKFSQYQHFFQFYKRKFCPIKKRLSRAISPSRLTEREAFLGDDSERSTRRGGKACGVERHPVT